MENCLANVFIAVLSMTVLHLSCPRGVRSEVSLSQLLYSPTPKLLAATFDPNVNYSNFANSECSSKGSILGRMTGALHGPYTTGFGTEAAISHPASRLFSCHFTQQVDTLAQHTLQKITTFIYSHTTSYVISIIFQSLIIDFCDIKKQQ